MLKRITVFLILLSTSISFSQEIEIPLVAESAKTISFLENPEKLKAPYSNQIIHHTYLYKFGDLQGGYRGGVEEFKILLTNNTGYSLTVLNSFKTNSAVFSDQVMDEIAGVMDDGTYQIWTIEFNTKNKIGPQNRWLDFHVESKEHGKAIVYRIYFIGSLHE